MRRRTLAMAGAALTVFLVRAALTVAQAPVGPPLPTSPASPTGPVDRRLPALNDAPPVPEESVLPPQIVPEPARAVAPAPAASAADPEQAARSFVERGTKEADEAVRALTKEAESLRARLQRVEAALARWQSVRKALEAADSSQAATDEPVLIPGTVQQRPAIVSSPANGVRSSTLPPTEPDPIPNIPPPALPR